MAAKVSKNNVLAGLFVVLAMVLAIVISVMVSGVQKRLAAVKPYTIRFTLADGAQGLKVDSPVNLGGQEVGRVTSIAFDPPPGSGQKIEAVRVQVVIRSDLTIYQDAWAFLEKPLLGSMSQINLSRVGGDKPVLQPEGELLGIIAPPSFLAQAGYGPEQATQVREMIAQAKSGISDFQAFASAIGKDYEPAMKGLRQAIDDINAITAQWRSKSPAWTAQVDSTLTSVDQAAGKLSSLGDQAQAVLARADKAIESLQAAIEENRGPLKNAVASVDAAVQRFKGDTMSLLEDTLQSAKTGADEFRGATERLGTLLKQEEPNIERILANLRLASDQVKLAMIEIRQSPWRALYVPKTKELESENLYIAARTYANAVSDLRAASEALKALSDGGPTPAGAEPIEHIKERLNEAFKKYQEAEKDLLQKMIEK